MARTILALVGQVRNVMLSILFIVALTLVSSGNPESAMYESSGSVSATIQKFATEEGEEEGELEPSSNTVVACVMGIISVIIGMSILFDLGKEAILDVASEHVKPIVLQMFQELTILGFLSLFVFLMVVTHLLQDISALIFGHSEEGEDYLGELVEMTHYLIFLVMAVNIVQVFVLIVIGNAAHKRYDEYNEVSQDEEAIALICEAYDKDEPLTISSATLDYFTDPLNAWRIHQEKIDRMELMHFHSMRKEFIFQRDPLPPHDPVEKNRLPTNFDYAEYLADCMGDFMCQLIETTPSVWAVVWLTALVFILFMLTVGIRSFLVPFAWVFLAFVDVGLIYWVHLKCSSIMKYLVNPSHLRPGTAAFNEMVRESEEAGAVQEAENRQKKAEGEKQPLLTESQLTPAADSEFPDIEDVPEDEIKKLPVDAPAWTLKKGNAVVDKGFCGMGEKKLVHRQHQLFWFADEGPEYNTFFLKTHLLLQSIYMAVLFLIFYPMVYKFQGVGVLIGYMIFSVIPIFALWTGFYSLLVSNMSQISCAGLLVNKEAVARVIRKQKTDKALKLILLLTKVTGAVEGGEKVIFDYNDPKISRQCKEIEEMFKHFDSDGDDILSPKEIDDVLDSMGIKLDDAQKQRMLIKLDQNGDGEISFEEFRDWQLSMKTEDEEGELKKTAKKIFDMFDEDGGGTLSIEELKHGLNKLNAGLTDEEVYGMLREFDTDGDGEIDLEEFEKVIENAYSLS